MASGVPVWILIVTVVVVAVVTAAEPSRVIKFDKQSLDSRESKDSSRTGFEVDEGRRHRRKKKLFNMIVTAKVVAASIIIPGIIGLALFASWKGVTISLLSFTMALFLGLRSNTHQSYHGKSGESIHTVVITDHNDHEHWLQDKDIHHSNSGPYRRWSQAGTRLQDFEE